MFDNPVAACVALLRQEEEYYRDRAEASEPLEYHTAEVLFEVANTYEKAANQLEADHGIA